MDKILERTISKNIRLIFAKNPKVGDKVWSFPGGRMDLEPREHILIEKLNEDHFKTNKCTYQHISNIYYEI